MAQFIPTTSTGRLSRAARAACSSVPTSIVPVASKVTWTWRGTSRPTSAMASRTAKTAQRTWRMSWAVSKRMRSTPPLRSPRAASL